ncbi:hypothetical protein [Thorsellia anophelis]|uniref:Uncharacterized protein n=1 Tax=Thorsellia anophelis DSM 18579 TaxID=1123402 RepID=A0A1I0G5P4_9GAMM|nr:hypothetical protein [Thorsellia anophelis]SET65967.1 hypothetical protein SAMN02583745_02991 [Thorsellia anophelis DSM 18579]
MTPQCIEQIKLVYQAKYSYAGLAEHHTPYDLLDFNPEQREQFNGLLEGYTPEFIHLVTVNKYTPEEAEAYILHRIDQERKFQEALNSMHPFARVTMEMQQIIGMVWGVKAAEAYLQHLKKVPLGLGSIGRSDKCQATCPIFLLLFPSFSLTGLNIISSS